MSGRRKAKPNRGGGRFNKPRGGGGGRGKSGGGGGAGARKAADNSWDDGDDFSLFDGPSRPPRLGGRGSSGGGGGRGIGRGRGRGRGAGGGSSRGRPKTETGDRPRPRPEENGRPRPKTELPRMPMQKIHMTSENQASVKELLRELQTQDFEEPEENCEEYSGSEPEEEEYDELDYRDDGQFWCTNDDPVEVSDSVVFEPDSEEEREVCEIPISYVAIGKLSRYGFDKERSKLALQSCNRDVGVSLEYLLQQCFKEKYGKRARSIATCRDITMEDCLVQRQEEAFALSSIYGDRFSERIHNRVWTVTVALEFLIEKSNNHKQGSANKETSQVLLKDVCRFYLKGAGCRFGTKCRFKHQMPTEPCPNTKKPMGPSQSSFESNTPPVYELEIRFPEGNRYPFQAPVVAFTTTDETLLLPGRLHISEYLYGEALVAAESGEPVVFTLITCLEDEAKMSELLANNHHKYSVPPPPLLPAIAPAKSKSVKRASPVQDVPKQLEVKKAVESEEEEEEEDLEDPPAVPVENESYVNFKKKFTKKYEWKAESVQQENSKLCRQFRNKQSSRRFLSMLQERQKLPAWQEKKNILEMLSRSQVLVVSGMTGCGKTTQIPQFILDDTLKGPAGKVANIICTQPRRISAISVAERVAQERAERLGTTVGYQIRLETVKSSATRLLYCTAGVLLRRLEGDTDLRGVTHVIVDEVHERTEERYVIEDGSPYMRSGKQGNHTSKGKSNRNAVEQLEDDMWSFMHFQKDEFVKDSIPDQQLTIQQMTVRYKGVSKSVLKTMATMDLDKINMDLVEAVLEWIVDGDHNYPQGAVLIFMPGLAEIKMLYEQLQSNRLFNGRRNTRCAIYPLHSSLSSEEQQAVFNRPPEGVTKIIISTNIAETSVTIDDVVYVIDSGKMKEKRYDASKSMESLEDSWVSRANALQRRGRAGRVASGVCFHLFTSHCFRHQLTEQQLPEIQRVPLEQLCLRIKILDMFADQPLESVFSSLIEPPAANSVEAAKQRLRDLGALTPDEKLTPLGYHLASLPVDVRIGKLMLFGAIFRCLDPALTIAASLAFKSPFVSPWDKREEANIKKLEFALGNSDHLALLQAYKGWKSAAKQGSQAGFRYCREHFLSGRVLQEIASLKRQFAELLSDIGFVKDGLKARVIERMSSKGEDGILEATGHEANSNADNIKLMSAMLCAALYPNVVQVRAPQGKYQLTSKGAVKMQPKADELKFMTKNDGSVHVHPSSVNYPVRHFDSPYLVYHEKVKTSRVFIRDCSMVSVYPLVLFGGGQVKVDLQRGEFVISLDDGWICFAAASHQVAELVKELRWELDQLLEDKIKNPTMDLCSCPRGSRIIDMIVKLVTTQ
ncbi:UNVERIFIED_CONTAM: hypothetical protein FKN15_077636 [Acipenser sinensis]